jgi:hypothetical protein
MARTSILKCIQVDTYFVFRGEIQYIKAASGAGGKKMANHYDFLVVL